MPRMLKKASVTQDHPAELQRKVLDLAKPTGRPEDRFGTPPGRCRRRTEARSSKPDGRFGGPPVGVTDGRIDSLSTGVEAASPSPSGVRRPS